MVVTEISIIHHVGVLLVLIWLLNSYNCCHPIVYFLSLIYLFQVHERYSMRLRRKLQFEQKKTANQRRILTDSETVRWLNHAVEKIWPICMEQIISQRVFLPIIPWFLEKYKPWTVKRATVQHLYLGRTPPLFTEIRVLRGSTDDDHLVLELGLNFLTADDMSAILVAKLRKRLGFGLVAKMHLTGMHVEGKVLVGVKFLRSWPFIGRLRVCFAEPPYFQMTVKPIFNHGLDVTELPGIAGWLDKLLAIAFEETLVEPNMLVVDLEKFVAPQPENWFSVDVKEPIGYTIVEVIEAADLKPSDLNGLSDPYVKGHLGPYRFRTQVQRKTLTPKWLEEFKIPICSWESQSVLTIEVRDKDRFVDDTLGDGSVNIGNYRDGQRHDIWLPLENIKMGRLHLAITVVEANGKGKEQRGEEVKTEAEKPDSVQNETSARGPISKATLKRSQEVADTFECIDVEGQKETGIWVHRPGSEVSQAWEPRKGKSRHIDTEILSVETPKSSAQSSLVDSSSGDESKEGQRKRGGNNIFQRGFDKLFHRSPKGGEDGLNNSFRDSVSSPHANVKAVHVKRVGVNFVVDDDGTPCSSNEGSGVDNSGGKHDMKDKAKHMLRNAKRSARNLKQALSRKGSSKFLHTSSEEAVPPVEDSDSSDDDEDSSLCDPGSSLKGTPIASGGFISTSANEPKPHGAVQADTTREVLDHPTPKKDNLDGPVVSQNINMTCSPKRNEGVPTEESLKPKIFEGKVDAVER